MKSEDLNKAHYKIWEKNPEISQSKEHTYISVGFAIKVLEKLEAHMLLQGCNEGAGLINNEINELIRI